MQWEEELKEQLDVCLPKENMALCVMAHACSHSCVRGRAGRVGLRIAGLPGKHSEPSPEGREEEREGREGREHGFK